MQWRSGNRWGWALSSRDRKVALWLITPAAVFMTIAWVAFLTVVTWVPPAQNREHGVFDGEWGVLVPFAAVTLIPVGLAAVVWWPVLRKWRRRKVGRCLVCGYDRRGLAPTAPCPECGAAPD